MQGQAQGSLMIDCHRGRTHNDYNDECDEAKFSGNCPHPSCPSPPRPALPAPNSRRAAVGDRGKRSDTATAAKNPALDYWWDVAVVMVGVPLPMLPCQRRHHPTSSHLYLQIHARRGGALTNLETVMKTDCKETRAFMDLPHGSKKKA